MVDKKALREYENNIINKLRAKWKEENITDAFRWFWERVENQTDERKPFDPVRWHLIGIHEKKLAKKEPKKYYCKCGHEDKDHKGNMKPARYSFLLWLTAIIPVSLLGLNFKTTTVIMIFLFIAPVVILMLAKKKCQKCACKDYRWKD